MQTTRTTARPGVIRRVLSLTGEIAREQRALAKASKRMPKPVPWDWAAPRLMPLPAGPTFDPQDLRTMRARSELGPMVEFGLDLGGVFATVDEEVAQRWEVTSQQLLEQSLANLRARAASIDPTQVINGVLSGHSVRILRDHPRWASSVILDEPALFRLFGTHDQILATPTRRSLISLPILTPSWVVADIVVDLEVGQLRALMLDAFVIEDRGSYGAVTANGATSWTRRHDVQAAGFMMCRDERQCTNGRLSHPAPSLDRRPMHVAHQRSSEPPGAVTRSTTDARGAPTVPLSRRRHARLRRGEPTTLVCRRSIDDRCSQCTNGRLNHPASPLDR